VQEDDAKIVNSPSRPNDPKFGEILMMKTFLKVPNAKDPPQRKSLLRTSCKSHVKLCNMIVDLGSIENLVSLEMVKKIKIKITHHLTPYRVSWLNKGQQVLVNEQSWVEFDIGDYKDKILCDVFPMDSCHILLGHTWKYHRKA
jgi:hypothetical protein